MNCPESCLSLIRGIEERLEAVDGSIELINRRTNILLAQMDELRPEPHPEPVFPPPNPVEPAEPPPSYSDISGHWVNGQLEDGRELQWEWTQHFTDSGREYFANHPEQTTQWEFPRPPGIDPGGGGTDQVEREIGNAEIEEILSVEDPEQQGDVVPHADTLQEGGIKKRKKKRNRKSNITKKRKSSKKKSKNKKKRSKLGNKTKQKSSKLRIKRKKYSIRR